MSREIQEEFHVNTILKTLGELLETMVPEASIKEFEAYDGSFEKLKTDKDYAEFNRNVSGRMNNYKGGHLCASVMRS